MENKTIFRTIRSELRLTQKQMGVMLGVKQSNYSGLENEQITGISSRVFTAMLENLNVNPLFIQKGEMPVFVTDKPLYSQRIRKEMDAINLTTAELALKLDPALTRRFNSVMDNLLVPSQELIETIFKGYKIDVEYVMTAKHSNSAMAEEKRPGYNKAYPDAAEEVVSYQDPNLLFVALQESITLYKELVASYKQQIEELKAKIKDASKDQN